MQMREYASQLWNFISGILEMKSVICEHKLTAKSSSSGINDKTVYSSTRPFNLGLKIDFSLFIQFVFLSHILLTLF